MFKTIVNAFKVKSIRNKIFITLALLLIYRIGCWIPVAGIVPDAFREAIFGENAVGGDFLQLISSVNGGALSNAAILALGVTPYISATIIIRLLVYAIPALERLEKAGEEGRRKIDLYSKICALILAFVQAIAIVVTYQSTLNTHLFGSNESPIWLVGSLVTLMLVAGSMFTYWLGEKITEIGIGSGVSLLIFVGILSSAGSALLSNITSIVNGDMSGIWQLVLFIVALIFIFGFIVFMDLSERRIPVKYAKQIRGRKMYEGRDTVIPIKLNSSGVMPIIFAMSIITFPQLLMSLFWPTSKAYAVYSNWLGAGSWIYLVVLGFLIVFFSFFWNSLTFQPYEIAKNLQQNGGIIKNVKPGKETAEKLSKILKRITLFGSLFLIVVAVIPSLIFKAIGTGGLINAFSATGLLIVVSVALEFDKNLETQMIMTNHKGFLK